jgi:hypothetical protein
MSVAEAGDWVVFSRGETSSVGAKLKTQAESHMMPIKFTAESFLRLITLAPDILEPQNGPGDPLQAGSHAQKLVEFTVVFRFPRAMRLSAGRHCVSPWSSLEALGAGTIGLLCCSWSDMSGADVRRKLLVPAHFVVTFHVFERLPYGRPRRAELPIAFRATPAMKIRSFDPHQSAALRLHATSPDSVR